MAKQFQLAAKRSFDEPVDTFTVGDQEFRLFDPPDSAKLTSLNLAARLRRGASEEAILACISAAIDFLGACMEPGEYQSLYELLVDPRRGMERDPLMDLCTWAVETVVARPTQRSTGSQRGRSAAGKKSTGAARSRA